MNAPLYTITVCHTRDRIEITGHGSVGDEVRAALSDLLAEDPEFPDEYLDAERTRITIDSVAEALDRGNTILARDEASLLGFHVSEEMRR